MALLWIDGFDHYGTAPNSSALAINSLLRRWKHCVDSESSFRVAYPQYGDGWALWLYANNLALTAPDLTTNATLVVGFRYQHGASVASTILSLLDGCDSNTPTIYVKVNDSSYLEVWLNDGTPALLATSSAAIDPGSWLYLELKVVCSATAGSVDLHVDGNSVATFTGRTKTDQQTDEYNTTFRLQNGVDQQGSFDDLYALDGTDPNSIGRNTDFLGKRCVWTLRPTGVNYTNWTPSSGTDNSALVRDQNGPDDDATYVSTVWSWESDYYYCDPLPDGITDISGVALLADVRRTGVVSMSFYVLAYSTGGGNGTEFDSPAVAVDNDLWKSYWAISETDPDTNNLQWTHDSINSAQLGFGSQ